MNVTIFSPENRADKKNLMQSEAGTRKSKKRITPRLCIKTAALTLFFVHPVFFSFPARAVVENKPAEMIICPERAGADRGSPLDEYYLARAYDKGYCDTALDKKKAEEWYTKAAEQGHMLAQYQLGEMYFSGDGQPAPDYPKAKKWYMAAAERGYGSAQLRLGFLFAEAHFAGLHTDYAEAEKWFSKAAEQDAGDARFRLGNFYHSYKTPPDFEKAILWLTRASEGGHRVAMFDLSRLLKNAGKTDLSLQWMRKSALLDFLPAQMSLSEMYANGNGAPKDPSESMIWTLKIAKNPVSPVYWTNRAADVFFEGWEALPKDYPQARKFYERAAAKDDAHALARLGQIYMEGLGIMADRVKALQYLQKSSSLGDKEADKLLTDMKGPAHGTPATK